MNRIDSLLSFRRTKYAKCTFEYKITESHLVIKADSMFKDYVTIFHVVPTISLKFAYGTGGKVVRPYLHCRCPYCKKVFNTTRQLKNHLRSCPARCVFNTNLRNFVLEVDKTTDVIDAYCYERRCRFQKQYGTYNNKSDALLSIASSKCDNFIDNYGKETFKAVERIRNSLVKRKQRVKERITHMLSTYDEVVFLTLTFKTPVLKSTTEEERRACVVSFLKSIHFSYVANIDYGKKNGREHYHCVVASRLSAHAILFWRSKFGRIGFEQINNHITDASKIGQYIAKLTNHAIKKTTKRQAIIYSRKK